MFLLPSRPERRTKRLTRSRRQPVSKWMIGRGGPVIAGRSAMIKYIPHLMLAALIAGAIGCDSVVLDAPIGERLTSDANSSFAGRWIDDESEIFEIRQTKGGGLVSGALVWDEKTQQYRAQTQHIDSRRIGSAIYFLWRDDPDGDFGFFRIERTGESELTMHLPDPAKYRSAVEDGKLDGDIIPKKNDSFTVRVHADSPSIKEIFGAMDISKWHLPDVSATYRRIKRFDESQEAEPAIAREIAGRRFGNGQSFARSP